MKWLPALLTLTLISTGVAQSAQVQWEYLVVRHRDVLQDDKIGVKPYFELESIGEPDVYSPKEFESKVRQFFFSKGLPIFSTYSLMKSEIVNYFGLQGWELTSVVNDNNTSNPYDKMEYFYFKRQVQK